MPRRKRLQPGQTYGNGIGLDLGGLLAGVFGGVESNPDFGAVEDKGEFGPQPLKQGADQPYKPRSVFDKNEAARRNADFKIENYLADQDVERDLTKQRGLNPILADREDQVGKIRNALELALTRDKGPVLATNQGLMDEVAVKKSVKDALIQMGILDTSDATVNQINEMNIPTQLETLKQGNLGKLAEVLGKRKQAEYGNTVFDATQADRLAKDKATAFTDAGLAAGQTMQIQDVLTNRKRMLQGEPVWHEAQSVSNRFQPVSPGTSLFDTSSGKLSYTAPDAMQRALAASKGGSGPQMINAPQPPVKPTGYKVDDLIIDPNTGEILGIK